MKVSNPKRAFMILLGLIVILTFHKGFCSEKEITSEGRSSISKYEALEKAKRNAVDHAVGTLISSHLMVEKRELIRYKILNDPDIYILGFHIIDEDQKPPGKDKNKEDFVKIKSLIKVDKIKKEVETLERRLKGTNFPRFAVIIIPMQNESSSINHRQVESSIKTAFLRKNFYLIDPEIMDKSGIEKYDRQKPRQGNSTIDKLWEDIMKPDIIVKGKVESTKNGKIVGSMLVSSTVILTLKVIRTDTGEILSTGTWDSAGAGINYSTAANVAGKSVAEMASKTVIPDVLNKYVIKTGGTHIIQIKVYNIIDLSDLDYLEKSLESKENGVPGIHQLSRRSFAEGIAIFDAKIKGDSDAIASAIQKKMLGKFKVVVTGFSRNVIRLTIFQNKKKKKEEK
jgi:hypothetical protein